MNHRERVAAAWALIRDQPQTPRRVPPAILRGTMGRLGWMAFSFSLLVFCSGILSILLAEPTGQGYRTVMGWIGLGLGALGMYHSTGRRWAWKTGLRWGEVGTARIESLKNPPQQLWTNGADYLLEGQIQVRTARRTFSTDFLTATPWAKDAYEGQIIDVLVHPRRRLVLVYLID